MIDMVVNWLRWQKIVCKVDKGIFAGFRVPKVGKEEFSIRSILISPKKDIFRIVFILYL